MKRSHANEIKTSSGRSIIEILGVLAVVAVLSLLVPIGIQLATNKWRATQIFKNIQMSAVDLSNRYRNRMPQGSGTELTIPFDTTTTGHTIDAYKDETFSYRIEVKDLDKGLCHQLVRQQDTHLQSTVKVNGVLFEGDDSVCEDNNLIAYYFHQGDQSTQDDPIPDDQTPDDQTPDDQTLCGGKTCLPAQRCIDDDCVDCVDTEDCAPCQSCSFGVCYNRCNAQTQACDAITGECVSTCETTNCCDPTNPCCAGCTGCQSCSNGQCVDDDLQCPSTDTCMNGACRIKCAADHNPCGGGACCHSTRQSCYPEGNNGQGECSGSCAVNAISHCMGWTPNGNCSQMACCAIGREPYCNTRTVAEDGTNSCGSVSCCLEGETKYCNTLSENTSYCQKDACCSSTKVAHNRPFGGRYSICCEATEQPFCKNFDATTNVCNQLGCCAGNLGCITFDNNQNCLKHTCCSEGQSVYCSTFSSTTNQCTKEGCCTGAAYCGLYDAQGNCLMKKCCASPKTVSQDANGRDVCT